MKFETISTDLPTKLHLELCDDSGNIVFSKRQNIYYIKLQEKLATLDCDKDYVLKITSIQDDIKTDEEVVIQNKKACDGGTKGKSGPIFWTKNQKKKLDKKPKNWMTLKLMKKL